MGENYKCPKCGRKPKFIKKMNDELVFFCRECHNKFKLKDKGFGYLPIRVMVLRELYP